MVSIFIELFITFIVIKRRKKFIFGSYLNRFQKFIAFFSLIILFFVLFDQLQHQLN